MHTLLSAIHCTVKCNTLLYCTVLYCIVRYSIVLHGSVLYNTQTEDIRYVQIVNLLKEGSQYWTDTTISPFRLIPY